MTGEQSQRAPYPGLRAFRREETDLFFGREDCINAMVDRLAATRFLAVLGSSGTGKSSLVKTGLLDAFELGLMAKAGSRWTIVDFRPGGAPLKNLARGLLEVESSEAGTSIEPQDVDVLRAFLARGPRAVIEWCAGHLPKGANLLLLVDQFEELFRYQDYAGREEAEAFVALLLESAREAQVPIYVTITMRSEYLGACALVEGLADAINAGMFLTPRMTREHCREAIVGPAAVCNIDIEPALVNRMLNDLVNFAPWDNGEGTNDQLDRLMRRADQLPLLQYTLNRMWQRACERLGDARITLTLDDYLAIEGLSGALNAHANQIFQDLGPRRAQVAELIFRALTSGSTVADAVRRPTRMDDLVASSGGDEPSARAVVDAFRAPGVNFLVPEYDPHYPRLAPDSYIDISHESLIRQWKKLSGWLEAEGRAGQQWRRLVDRHNNDEQLGGRDLANFIAWRSETNPNPAWAKRYGGDYPSVIDYLDKRQRKENVRRIAMIATTASVFALITGSAIYSIQQRNYAVQQRELVELNQLRFTKAFTELFFALQAPLSSANSPIQTSPSGRAGAPSGATDPTISREEQQAASQPESIEIPPESVDRATADTETRQSLALTTVRILEDTARKLYESNPTSLDFQRLFVVGLIQLGDAKVQAKDLDGAEKAFIEGIKTVTAMLQTNPTELQWLDDHALALAGLGRVNFQRGDFAKAREFFEGAIGIERQFATRTDDRLLKNLQTHLGELGDTFIRMREPGQARKTFEERLEVRRERLKLDPKDLQRWVEVSVALDRVGQLLRDDGDLNGSRKYFEQALKIDRELVRINPKRRNWQENLVFSLMRIGDLDFRLARYSEALPFYNQARELQQKIATDPNAAGPLQTMASILGRVGDINRRLKSFPAAIAAHREELELRRRLLARDQKSLATLRSVSSALDYLGNALRESKDLDGARAAFTEQLTIDRGLVEADPKNSTSLLDLAWSLNRLGDLDRDTKRPSEAARYYQEALGIQHELFEREPDNAVRMRALALIASKLGLIRSQLNDHKTALALHTEELDLRTKLFKRAGGKDIDALRDLSLANDRVGNALRDLKDFKGALTYFLAELEIDRGFAKRAPDNITALQDLQWTLGKVADFVRDQLRDPAGARKYLEELIGVDRRLIERQPANKDRHRRLRNDLDRLAALLLQVGDPAAARETYGEIFVANQRWIGIVREDYDKAATDANRDNLAQANGDAGWHGILAGRARDALPFIKTALSLNPNTPWNTVNLGHVHMFLGQLEDALELFKSVKDRNRGDDGKRTYANEIKDDFDMFRRLGLTPAGMDRVVSELNL